MSNERYVNTPIAKTDYDALKARAQENGRNPARELAQIAKRVLKTKSEFSVKQKEG